MTNPKSFLILRMSSAGDVIHGLPVAAALKKKFPQSTVSWLVEDRFADLLQGIRVIDEIIIIPRHQWRNWNFSKRAKAILNLIKKLRSRKFAISIDLQGLSKSSIAGILGKIPRRIGFAADEGKELAKIFNNELLKASGVHVVEMNLSLLKTLGITVTNPDFCLPELQSKKIDKFLHNHKLISDKILIINPGAGWPAKKWSLPYFADVIKELQQRHPLTAVVTWGGKVEKKMAETIVNLTEKNAVIAPETNLKELWYLLTLARLYLGCDTGPTHMAAAAGVPTVALFGPTSGLRNGPYGSNHAVVQGCCQQYPRCWKKRWRNSCTCMQQITPAQVSKRCLELLA